MIPTSYPSDLPDSSWNILQPFLKELLPCYSRKSNLHEIVNAISYRLRSGCAWRYLPNDFPDWKLVYYYFTDWTNRGIIHELNSLIVKYSRENEIGSDEVVRNANPSALVVDAQTVKSTVWGERDDLGFDGNKRINGVKRHTITDTGGRVLACIVEAANKHEGPILRDLLVMAKLDGWAINGPVYADAGYKGQEDSASIEGYKLEVVKRTDYVDHKKLKNNDFEPLPKRWVIEQTFGCLLHFRGLRLSHNRRTRKVETSFLLGNILRILKRIIS